MLGRVLRWACLTGLAVALGTLIRYVVFGAKEAG